MRALHIILLVVGVSIPWLVILKKSSYEYSNDLDTLNTRLAQLQLNLDEKTRVNQQLGKNLVLAQKARLQAEKQQNFMYEKLVSKNEEISGLISGDWETRYSRAEEHNNSLIQRIDYLEKKYQLDLHELGINQQNLLDLNDSLTNDLIRLEFEYDDLNSDMHSVINNYREEHKQLQLQSEEIISRQQEQIRLLTLKNDSLNEIINKITAGSGKNTLKLSQSAMEPDNNDYRKNRITSLSSALANRSSNERKQILISVIPTIPDGIYAEELLAMTDNMESSDTFQVVTTVEKYIVRPVDNKIIDALTTKLEEADAELITKILTR